MPQVPVYQPQQVQPGALPGARVSVDAPLEAFGGGQSRGAVADATNRLLNPIQKMAEQASAEADEVKLHQFRRELNDFEINFRKQAAEKKGEASFALPDELAKSYDTFWKDREKSFTSTQLAGAQKIAESRRAEITQWTNGYMGQERQRFEQSEFEANLESSKDRGASDPMLAPKEQEYITRLVSARAQKMGLPKEAMEQEVQKQVSDLHAKTVNNLLSQNQDSAAEGYFKATEKYLDPDMAAKLRVALEEGARLGAAQKGADEIMGQAKNLTEALSLAREQFGKDPKTRQAVEQQLEHKYAVRETARRQREEDVFRAATNIVEQRKSFDAIPNNLKVQLPLSARSSLRTYADSLATGRKIDTNLRLYEELKMMAADPGTRNKLLETNLYQYADRISQSDLKSLIDWRDGLRNGDSKTEAELDGIQSDIQIRDGVMKAAGIDPSPKDDDKEAWAKATLAKRQIDLAVKSEQERLGRKLKNEEVQKIAETQMVQGVTQKAPWYMGGDTKKRRFELNPDEPFAVPDIATVPRSEKQRIENYLRGKGISPTDAKVLEFYNQLIGVSRGAR